jgi:hypothetical protein
MKKFFEAIYYRFKIHHFELWNDYDKVLDKTLLICLESGIKKFYTRQENIFRNNYVIEFKNRTELSFERFSIYNGFPEYPKFKFDNGQSIEFRAKRPSAKTMYLFKKDLENFKINKIEEITNYKIIKNLKKL